MNTGLISRLTAIGVLSLALLPALHAATDNAVVTAAKDGDLRAVRALVAKRINVNEPARDGSTALLWAVYHSDAEMTKALLTAGAKVDTPNKYGVTPLIQASRSGDTPLIDLLLKSGAKATLAHPDGETALMAAARTGHLDAVRLLIEANSDVNATTYQQETALMWAAAEGHADVVKALLDAKADPNRKARVTTIEERKHADHPTGGFTALMYAVRNGHEAVARVLAQRAADLNLANGDGVTALIVAIVNDRFDLAATLVDLGADANDGSLYFAVDMHDATTDMRARDGSRLRTDYPNKMTALDLIAKLLDHGADPNKAFTGQLHSATLCCSDEINASPFYRAAVAADVEALKLMLKKGADVEWSPKPVKKPGNDEDGGGGRGNANVGRTPVIIAINGGRGAAFAAGPGFERLGAPPFREASNREPVDAIKVLLAAGANPNIKTPDGSTPLHQAVTARQVPIIQALVAAGAKLDAVNKDNLTPLLLAEKPEPPPPPGNNTDARAFKPKRNTREEVIAALRELMRLGPNDPAPVPPPLPKDETKKDDKKTEDPQ
ncbi:MAG TPA: ankyrin repeat domain-containing protein [Vicinamibacterales bacterium]|nr:ankyrin repeat domain-containing protein [Vicinamibacterales bacterium]